MLADFRIGRELFVFRRNELKEYIITGIIRGSIYLIETDTVDIISIEPHSFTEHLISGHNREYKISFDYNEIVPYILEYYERLEMSIKLLKHDRARLRLNVLNKLKKGIKAFKEIPKDEKR